MHEVWDGSRGGGRALVCVVAALLSLSAGCGPVSGPPDGSLAEDASVASDAPLSDGGSGDGASPADASLGSDAATSGAADSGVEDDAAGGCSCETPALCQVLSGCAAGSCVYEPAPDGTPCRGGGTCAGGTCVAGGCGNGTMDGDEACDDGNRLDGDACSPSCAWTPFELGEGWPTAQSPAVAIDDAGAMLLVWTAPLPAGASESTWEVHAARLSAEGGLLDTTPLVLESDIPVGWAASPRVAGLAEGWAVVWRSPSVEGTAELGGIALARVSRSGVIAAPVVASVETRFDQTEPLIARSTAGVVVAWTDRSGLHGGDRGYGVRARTFDAALAATSGEMVVPVERGGDEVAAALAASGSRWAVAWTTGGVVVARRFDGTSAVDTLDLNAGEGSQPSLALTAHGTLGLARVSRADEARGDVVVTSLLRSGSAFEGPVTLGASAAEDRWPSIAPLGMGWLVAWQAPGTRRGVEIAAVGAPEPAALATLRAELGSGTEGDTAIAALGPRFAATWSGLGGPLAPRSVRAFILEGD